MSTSTSSTSRSTSSTSKSTSTSRSTSSTSKSTSTSSTSTSISSTSSSISTSMSITTTTPPTPWTTRISVVMCYGATLGSADITTMLTYLTVVNGTVAPILYTFNAIATLHRVSFYHIIPDGVTDPSNRVSLDGPARLYTANSAYDTTLTQGSRRAAELSGDVVLYIDNMATFDPTTLPSVLNALVNSDRRITKSWGFIVTKQDAIERTAVY